MSTQSPLSSPFQIKESSSHEDIDSIARFVLDENLRLVYANSHFKTLSHIRDGEKVLASDVIQCQNGADLSEIESGQHAIFIRGDTIPLDFHFDRIEAAEGKKFLIASEVNEAVAITPQSDVEFFQNVVGRVQKEKSTSTSLKTTAQDITLEKAMGSLKEDGDLRHFLNMSNEIMIVADNSGDLIRVNKTFHKLLGLNDVELNGISFLDLFSDDDRPYIRNCLQTLTIHDEKVGIVDFEARMQCPTGELYWMEWRLQLRGDFIYCVGRDMTAIKSHENELLTQEKQLIEAEVIGRMGRWHWNVGEDHIEWSDQIFRIFGVTQKDFTPSIDGLNNMVHRRDVGRVVQGFQRAIIEENDYDMEFRIVRPGGDIRYIRCEGRCERDAEGDVIALYGIMQDMTERMLYERELKEAKDAAERAYAAKSQFLANMSHELRTPLNAIIGFSEMMQRQLLGPIGTEKYLDYIGGIRESGEHLLDLISDILDMSKIEAGKHELDLEDVNVSKTIKLAVHMMEGRALESGVRISTEKLDDESTNIIADRRAFMQIILNVLSNAVKFSKDGGNIWIDTIERSEHLSIKIRDEGVGIPANKLHCVLRPFEQASSSYSRDHEGSGLGLAITKELVEMHGGSLGLESQVDEGTTVTIRIPFDASKHIKVRGA